MHAMSSLDPTGEQVTNRIAPKPPKDWERNSDLPFSGLFGDTAQLRVLQEIVADPHSDYRPKDLRELTGLSEPSVGKAVSALVAVGILKNISNDRRRPIYRANTSSRKLMALTFLAYAMIDDRDGTEAMDHAIRHYCGPSLESLEGARISPTDMFIEFMTATGGKPGRGKASAGARVYMSQRAAQKFADAMARALRGPAE